MKIHKRAPAPNTDGWLTRAEATDLLACSVQTLRNHEQRGNLHPQKVQRLDSTKTPRATVVYDPEEIAKLPRYTVRHAHEGVTASRAFELFDNGHNMRYVVRELCIEQDKVRKLHEDWLDMGGADVVVSPQAQDALDDLLGEFTDIAHHIDCIAKMKAAIEGIVGPCANAAEMIELLGAIRMKLFTVPYAGPLTASSDVHDAVDALIRQRSQRDDGTARRKKS